MTKKAKTVKKMTQELRPLSYRQLLAALQELDEDQLDMSIIVVDKNEIATSIMDMITVGEIDTDEMHTCFDDDNQPLLLMFVKE